MDEKTIATLAQSRTFTVVNGRLEDPREDYFEQSKTSPFKPNLIIDSKYRINKLLGHGGMGAVYHAHHLNLGKDVALKTLLSSAVDDEAWQRFQREVRAVAKLDSKNVVRVFDFGVTDTNQPYFTMELLEGESLADRIKRLGALSLDETISIFADVANGLTTAHEKGIIHRDLKPGNIFLELEGNRIKLAKVVDFGLAKLIGDQAMDGQKITATGTIFGSPLYMSPEQSMARKDTDHTTDIYSFGCALFETLTGCPPFVGKNAYETIAMHQTVPPPQLSSRARKKKFPQWVDLVIAGTLEKDNSTRIQSFPEIMEIFAHYSDPRTPDIDIKSGEVAAAKEEAEKRQRTIKTLLISAAVVASAAGLTISGILANRLKSPKQSAAAIALKKEAAKASVAKLAQNVPSLENEGDILESLDQRKAAVISAEIVQQAHKSGRFVYPSALISTDNIKSLAQVTITDINLSKCVFEDVDFRPLAKTQVEVFSVDYSNFTDADAAELVDCKQLWRFLGAQTKMTDLGLSHLAKLPALKRLEIQRSQISDKGLAYLEGKEGLELLRVSATPVTAAAIRKLCQSIRSLNIVDVAHCPNISAADIAALSHDFPNVTFNDKAKDSDPAEWIDPEKE